MKLTGGPSVFVLSTPCACQIKNNQTNFCNHGYVYYFPCLKNRLINVDYKRPNAAGANILARMIAGEIIGGW